MTQAYPLQWPTHIKRTKSHLRQPSRFDVTADRTRRELRREAEMAGKYVVISTNVELRRDGEPYASHRPPDDPGVAVYFERNGKQACIACDKHPQVWENMRAIGKTLEAMRAIERWGTAELLDQAFAGFTALPPPDQMTVITTPPPSNWWEVLRVQKDAPIAVVKGAYRGLVRETPEDERAPINLAYEAAKEATNG